MSAWFLLSCFSNLLHLSVSVYKTPSALTVSTIQVRNNLLAVCWHIEIFECVLIIHVVITRSPSWSHVRWIAMATCVSVRLPDMFIVVILFLWGRVVYWCVRSKTEKRTECVKSKIQWSNVAVGGHSGMMMFLLLFRLIGYKPIVFTPSPDLSQTPSKGGLNLFKCVYILH